MKIWKKILIGFFAFSILIGILQNLFPKKATEPVKKETVKPFKDFTEAEKTQAINDFINGNGYTDTKFKVNEMIKLCIQKSVKYPETIEYLYNEDWVDGKSTYVFDRKNIFTDSKIKNRLFVYVDFRSENSFSQKVRNKFKFVFDFKGNEPYEFVDANFVE